jgi:hypothetical protein
MKQALATGHRLDRQRRLFLSAAGCLAGLLVFVTPSHAQNGKKTTKPHSLHKGPHLFLDDFLIEKAIGLTRTIHSPKRERPEPVVTGPKDKNFQPYMTILQDEKTKRLRIWYNLAEKGKSHLGYMESKDGIHWQRPHRVLADPAPIIFGASVLDEGPSFPVPAQRYKFVW